MGDFARIAGRLFNSPIALRPEKAEMLVAVLAERLGIARLDRMDGSAMTKVEMNEVASEGRDSDRARNRLFELVEGIAIIPIEGTLVHRSGWVGAWSGMTGYDGIATMFRQAIADPEVKGIWLDIDSPGGEVAGCFDLCDEIYACNAKNGGKPVWVFVNEQACSAACALMSCGDKVFGPRTMITASIGVYVLFLDRTKAIKKDGLAVEFIRSGTEKAKSSGLETLTEKERGRLQERVDADATIFINTVARNRGIGADKVRGLEGAWLGAEDALAIGLVDGITSEVEALAKFQRSLARAG